MSTQRPEQLRMPAPGSDGRRDAPSTTSALAALAKAKVADIHRLPFSIRILLENLLRHEDGRLVAPSDVARVAAWKPEAPANREVPFMPARVLLQDFTGVPAVVDLAAMRDAMQRLGGDPRRSIRSPGRSGDRPLRAGRRLRLCRRVRHERRRASSSATASATSSCAGASGSFQNFRVVPPETGICHQVNLEYLAQVVFSADRRTAPAWRFPGHPASAPTRTRR